MRTASAFRIAPLLALALSAPAAAADDSPIATVETYLRALHAGDVSALTAVTVGPPEQQKLLAGEVEMVAAEKALREAILKAFPAAAKELPDPAAGIDQQIKTARTFVDKGTATVVLADSLQRLTLKQHDGRWKLDLAAMYPAESLPDFVRFRAALTKSVKSLTADVAAGQFQSLDEVKRELDTRVKVQLALPPEEATTQPTR